MNSTFVSLDIETTGLDPETCQTIEIGAVIDDWLNPIEDPDTFDMYVVHEHYHGEPYALSMHPKIFRDIATGSGKESIRVEGLAQQFAMWLAQCGMGEEGEKIVVAGKNFAGFDARFLSRIPHWDEFIKFHYRVLDPTMLCWNPMADSVPPSSKDCMKRCHMDGEVAHTALEDAIMVAKMIQDRVKQWKIMNVGMI